MSINLKTGLRDLRRQTENSRPKEAEKWVDILSGYFDDKTLTHAQIGKAIDQLTTLSAVSVTPTHL